MEYTQEELNDICTVDWVRDRYEYFKENKYEGDPVEGVIYLLWDSEEGYGNPYELTEQEHDNIVRPMVEQFVKDLVD
jgi:hypothetical protein